MPFVNVKILDDNVTAEQKNQVIAEITQTLVTVLGKLPEACSIIIDEVTLDNWGVGGQAASRRRAERLAAEAARANGTVPQ
jgi:4-oxalocrotonate tautomerase